MNSSFLGPVIRIAIVGSFIFFLWLSFVESYHEFRNYDRIFVIVHIAIVIAGALASITAMTFRFETMYLNKWHHWTNVSFWSYLALLLFWAIRKGIDQFIDM